MTNLKDINFGLNAYCGPSVLSALTGESTDRCAAAISAVSGKKEIRAVERTHLIEALKRLRFDVSETPFSGSTLYGTLHRMHTHDGLYIVFVKEHVVAVEVIGTEIFICDNHTKKPLDIRNSARLSQRVERVLKVTPKDPPKFFRREIKARQGFTSVEILKFNIYEKSEDNTKEVIGSIRTSSYLELGEIIKALEEILK